jgi:hypothetical protein
MDMEDNGTALHFVHKEKHATVPAAAAIRSISPTG